MTRRELITAAVLAGIGTGIGSDTGRRLEVRRAHRAALVSPLALSDDVLDTLHKLATPTLLGIGLQRPSPHALRFDTVTPNNALKWREIQRHGWAPADAIASLGQPMRAHTPLWGKEQGRTPAGKVEGFVRAIADRYQGQIYAWDIVNEPIHIPHCLDLVPHLVQVARDVTPGAAIIVNEFDAIRYLPGYKDSSCLTELIAFALKVGADGVGLQAHGNRWYSRTELVQTFNEIQDAGLICHITEAIYRSDGSPISYGHVEAGGDYGRWTEENQALAYRDLLAVARAHPAVKSVTFWTLRDADAWKQMPTGGLIDAKGRAKAAWDIVCNQPKGGK